MLRILANKFSWNNLRVIFQYIFVGVHTVVKSDSILKLAVSLADKNRWPLLFAELWHEDIRIWEIFINSGSDYKLT